MMNRRAPFSPVSPYLTLLLSQAEMTALLASAAKINALPAPSLLVESNGKGSLLSVRAKVASGGGTNTIIDLATLPPSGRTITPSNFGLGATVTLSVTISAGAPAAVVLPPQDFGFRVDGAYFQVGVSNMGTAKVQNGGGTLLADFDVSTPGGKTAANLATSNAEAVAKAASWSFVRPADTVAGRLVLSLTITSL